MERRFIGSKTEKQKRAVGEPRPRQGTGAVISAGQTAKANIETGRISRAEELLLLRHFSPSGTRQTACRDGRVWRRQGRAAALRPASCLSAHFVLPMRLLWQQIACEVRPSGGRLPPGGFYNFKSERALTMAQADKGKKQQHGNREINQNTGNIDKSGNKRRRSTGRVKAQSL